MDKQEEQRVRQWVRNWEAAAPVLEQLRAEDIRNSDTAAAIEQLSDAFESARRHWTPPAPPVSSNSNAYSRSCAHVQTVAKGKIGPSIATLPTDRI